MALVALEGFGAWGATFDGAKSAAKADVELVCLLARMIEAGRLYHTFGNIDGKSMCCKKQKFTRVQSETTLISDQGVVKLTGTGACW